MALNEMGTSKMAGGWRGAAGTFSLKLLPILATFNESQLRGTTQRKKR